MKNTARNLISSKPNKRWYLLSNQSDASIYTDGEDKHSFHLIERLINSEGPAHESDLDSDKPGTSFSSAGNGTIKHSLDRRFNKHEKSVLKFAKIIADKLELELQKEHFSELVIAAEPHFLGILRKKISNKVANHIKLEINRDYQHKSETEAYRLIKQELM